jgi:hypothetical protein
MSFSSDNSVSTLSACVTRAAVTFSKSAPPPSRMLAPVVSASSRLNSSSAALKLSMVKFSSQVYLWKASFLFSIISHEIRRASHTQASHRMRFPGD